jgi:hypothetical protein
VRRWVRVYRHFEGSCGGVSEGLIAFVGLGILTGGELV